MAQIALTAVVGRTVSELSGGKFANGTVTAAMQFAFNQMLSQGRGEPMTTEQQLALSPDEFNEWMDTFPEPTLDLETAIAFQPPSLLQPLVDGFTGFGDGAFKVLTLGFGDLGRVSNAMNIDGGVNYESG